MSRLLAGLVAIALLVGPAAEGEETAGEEREPTPSEREELLWQHRNLGKALYENPATQYEAVEVLQKALELAPDSVRDRINYGLALLRAGRTEEGIEELEEAQEIDPSIPHSWFNLGIEYKRQGRYEAAIRQLEGMLERVPAEPITHYNLGVLHNLRGDGEEALRHFREAARLDPDLAGPRFQLASAYRKAGQPEKAARETKIFREIKTRKADDPIPEDLEWSYYAELYDPLDPADPAPPAAELKLEAVALGDSAPGDEEPAATRGIVILDADGDGGPDLLSWSRRGIRLWLDGSRSAPSGLEDLAGVRAVVPGDLDDDGLADLCILFEERARLFRSSGEGFAALDVDLPAGPYHAALWHDHDHDNDLDLFLFGPSSRLIRNQGDLDFADRTSDFPFVDGEAVAGTRFDLVADTQATDLAVAYADRSGVLYRDLLGGRYEARSLDGLPPLTPPTTSLQALDFDSDGWTDLAAADSDGAWLLENDRREGFSPRSVPDAATPLLFVDLENRGGADLLAGGLLLRYEGGGRFAPGAVPATLATALDSARALATADFDSDGRPDLVVLGVGTDPLLLRNRTPTENGWLRVTLEGVKTLELAPGAEVEVKAGRLYQKRLYRGVPLHFGLADHETVDTVRITWPNGLIQNETRQPANSSAVYEEAQRLSGSCPMVFTWNGEELEFITDILGVAPLGASAGDGAYFPVGHEETIQLPRGSLAPRADGTYDVRITEELREVGYLDEARLLAVDHPSSIDVLTNQKFRGPPYPELRLFGTSSRHDPVTARDHRGEDVLSRVTARDGVYPDEFERDFSGVAELHHLELEFDELPRPTPNQRRLLVLSGWVDWADGSTFLRRSQGDGPGLMLPRLQIRDTDGRWRTVVEEMGIPAGKPKTIVVDLTDLVTSESPALRIVTNLCVYWDEIYVTEAPTTFPREMTALHPLRAELRFRGFSRVEIDPERKQPERFVYSDVRPVSPWNPTPGLYTRYGDVRELLSAVDDRFVVMGSGDELRLRFDSGALPPIPAGWERDFLLQIDGWAKDGDANTAHSRSVEPLPYHGMPGYPYSAPHHYPDDPDHVRYRERYLTRPALRLIRPLVESRERVSAPEPDGRR